MTSIFPQIRKRQLAVNSLSGLGKEIWEKLEIVSRCEQTLATDNLRNETYIEAKKELMDAKNSILTICESLK